MRRPLPDGDELRLNDPVHAPDLTRAIMGRLGYMRISPAARRRRMLRKWGSRAALTCVAAVAVSIGLHAYENGPTVRRPAGPTVPAAIGSEIMRQQNRIGGVIQTIRNLVPPPQDQPPGDPSDEREAPGEPVGDDVNSPSSSSPLRWV
jgi:hypothetical protein